MGRVYRVSGINTTEYFGTAREADRSRPDGEEPQGFLLLDATWECRRLHALAEDLEAELLRARGLLRDLRDACPAEVIEGTGEGRAAAEYLREHPLPPATAADRDGQRSYGA